jgi:hypothetical protein
MALEGPRLVQAGPSIFVVPAWSAGTQVDREVSGRILRAWMPAIHAGMAEAVDGQMPSTWRWRGGMQLLFHAL